MKVLLDENVNHKLRRPLLVEFVVETVAYLGWKSLKNGSLLRKAAESDFDVMLTFDQGIEFEQNVDHLPVAVLLIVDGRQQRPGLPVQPLVDIAVRSLRLIEPRQFLKVFLPE